MYNMLNTSGLLTIPEMQFQKKLSSQGDISLEFVE